ncbi:MAG: helix-turn-helix domain-containing protein [Bacteroidales bacterium]|nr:helix-turn-helix domain-containing protein [Bacteroidales bacterium]
MKSFGEYIRKSREDKGLPLRKVAAALDIDTSILSKIERNERRATTEMIPILAESLEKSEKEIEMQFIQSAIITDFGELKYLKDGLKETLKTI